MEKQLALELLDFINESITAYHAAYAVKSTLDEEGFVEIKENEKWNLVKGGKYYVMKNQSAIVAFEIGEGRIRRKWL